MNIKISISDPGNDKENEMDVILKKIEESRNINIEKAKQSGFDAVQLLIYFISCGSASVLIKAISQIIVKIISRDDVKSIKVNEIEIKGYNPKQVDHILSSIAKNKKKI